MWQSVLGELELSVSHASFETWFKDTELLEYNDKVVTIGVINVFCKTQLEKRFNEQIREVLAHNNLTAPTIQYEVKKEKKKILSRETTHDTAKDNRLRELVATPSPTRGKASHAHETLNPRYTFESFVVGSCNDLAYTACQAAAAAPGTKYNPLFIYGGVGLGKTHLIQAVGNEIIKNDPNMKVAYISTETFMKEFLEAVRFKKAGFSDKYRKMDVLIVDDIQFIAGREKTQEEFFHTFNTLHQANRQIIISSDKPPRSIPTLTERLRSRFEWGMAIDIQMPDFETRCAIVKAKAALSSFELDSDVVEYLATNFKTNIRELEGALNRLLAYAEMQDFTPDIMAAEGILGDMKRTRPQHITAKQIIDKTARYYNIEVKDMCSARRDKFVAMPRQIAMYLLRSELKMSFPKIAQELGRKDHTTAMHSVNKVTKESTVNISIREQINDIRDKLYVH